MNSLTQCETKTLYGTKEQLLPIAQELMRLRLPTGMRQLDIDRWTIEFPSREIASMEKTHISYYCRGNRAEARVL